MSVEAVTWALRAPLSGTLKVLLIGLANHATAEFDEARPCVERLATYANCDRRNVQRSLRKLEESGWIEATGTHAPRGRADRAVNVYRLTGPGSPYHDEERGGAGAASLPDGAALAHERGGAGVPNGAALAPPEPSLGTSLEPSGLRSSARGSGDEVPEGFPDELRPHARHVMRVLVDLARRHGSQKVTARSLGNVIMARPHHPLVRAAHDFAAWADEQPGRRRDVLSGYRNWLDKCGELATFETLPGEGPSGSPGNVTPLRRGEHPASRRIREMEQLKQRLREGGTL